jgi:putative phosphoribosyl transferase
MEAIFEDRRDAGKRLVEMLQGFRGTRPVVLGLPRGGVEVAYVVAEALDAPLDVIVARKLGAPIQPELGFGAVAPGGITLIDEQTARLLRLDSREIEEIAAREREEVRRRLGLYRGGSEALELEGRTVLVVDDGLATGVTARAALAYARQAGAGRIALAAPVAAPGSANAFKGLAEVFVAAEPEPFEAVGKWYRDFRQITDEEVIELLRRSRQRQAER